MQYLLFFLSLSHCASLFTDQLQEHHELVAAQKMKESVTTYICFNNKVSLKEGHSMEFPEYRVPANLIKFTAQ